MTMLRSTLLLLGLVSTALSLGCPPEESISPCTCIEDDSDDEPTVTCMDEKLTQDDLRRILRTFDQQDSLALELSRLNLGKLPHDFFQGVNVKMLEFRHCQLESLGERPLTGLEKRLEVLVISSSVLNDDANFKLTLGHLKRLKEVYLYDNSIPELGDDWFRGGLKTLTHLVLANNNIGTLGHKAFAGLDNLEIFELEGNRFGPFRRSMLPSPASKLWQLNLDNNGLTSLPADMFSGMPTLAIMSLKTNGLNKIPQEIFGTVWEELILLDMSDNSIECDSHLEWMLNPKIWSLSDLEGTCQTPPEKEGVELKGLLTGKVPL